MAALAADLGVTRTAVARGSDVPRSPAMTNDQHRAVPPQMLDGGRVVCFARLNDVRPTGNTAHVVAGEVSPRFHGLAIIEYEPRGPYYLLYCDQDWYSLTDTWHETLEEAKAQAAFEFKGVDQAWRIALAEA